MPNPIFSVLREALNHVPISYKDDSAHPYLIQLRGTYSLLLQNLNGIDEKYYGGKTKDHLIKNISFVQKEICKSVEEYLQGAPSKGFIIFSQLFDDTKNAIELQSQLNTLQVIKYSRNAEFFRCQKQHDDISSLVLADGFCGYKKKEDLFHVPFDQRKNIPSYRFSISGFPCLYISKKLLTSYSECFPQEESNFGFHGISFRAKRPLSFLDISQHSIIERLAAAESESDEQQQEILILRLLDLIELFQLVLACHTKVQYDKKNKWDELHFKADYIVPQFLLQWLKTSMPVIDGIRYWSCTGSRRFNSIGEHYNYVLPATTNIPAGHCNGLKSLFSSTEVYTYNKNLQGHTNDLVIVSIKSVESELRSSTFSQLW